MRAWDCLGRQGKAAGFRTWLAGFVVWLTEAAPGVHPAKARRIAADIARLPELLQT
jgi:hypothetical protein